MFLRLRPVLQAFQILVSGQDNIIFCSNTLCFDPEKQFDSICKRKKKDKPYLQKWQLEMFADEMCHQEVIKLKMKLN